MAKSLPTDLLTRSYACTPAPAPNTPPANDCISVLASC